MGRIFVTFTKDEVYMRKETIDRLNGQNTLVLLQVRVTLIPAYFGPVFVKKDHRPFAIKQMIIIQTFCYRTYK
jgi:hypothetical protein